MRHKVDVAVLTVIPLELKAARLALGIQNSGRRKDDDVTITYSGTVASALRETSYSVLVTCIGRAGTSAAASAAREVIEKFRPRAVLLVGIAAGLRGKVRIGHVVFSDRVVAYEPAAIVTGGDGSVREEPRPEVDQVPHAMNQDLVNYECNAKRLEAIFRRIGGKFPSAREGLEEEFRNSVASSIGFGITTIASGEKLLRDPSKLLAVRSLHGKTEVGEMEAGGIVNACRSGNIPWMVIRGISDFGDLLKDDRFHEFAASAAAAVLADFITYGLDLGGPSTLGQLESPVGHTNGTQSGEPYIVGRDKEVNLLQGMMEATRSPSILNIYGPAGIGKTTLCEKLGDWCQSQQIPSATVDLYSLFNVTVHAIACKLRDMLVTGDNLHVARWDFQEVQRAFREFNRLVEEHDQIKSAITRHGDVTRVFDKYGFLKERYRLSFAHGVFARREGLEKYLREVDGTLAESFIKGVTLLANSRRLVLFVDTWEKLEHSPSVEEWLSTKLLPNLPSGAKAVLFGRSQAQKFASRLGVLPHLLEALSEVDSKTYLRHHGLQDHKALDAVFEVTKGYPLCLALACELSRKARTWDAVSKISVAPEAIAEELLKRLLEEEGVEEVRDFLERGIVAEWFDRGSIRYILGVSEARAKKIYQRIRGYSFVRPHPHGLQFHEGIRDILRRRLEAQNKKEYARLTKKWADYFRKSQEAHL